MSSKYEVCPKCKSSDILLNYGLIYCTKCGQIITEIRKPNKEEHIGRGLLDWALTVKRRLVADKGD